MFDTPDIDCGYGRPQWGTNGHFSPLEIETKNENFLEKLKSAAKFRSIYYKFLQWQFIYHYDTHIARKPITPVRSYACRGGWSNLRAVCSVCLYCVTIASGS